MANGKLPFSRRVLTSSLTPWVLFASSLIFIGLATFLPFVASEKVVDDLFRAAVLGGVAEILLAVYAIVSWLETERSQTGAQADIVVPPGSINEELLKLVNATTVGQLTVICYGSNRFGKVLDSVAETLPLMRTSVLVCHPDRALDPSDKVAIMDFIDDMKSVSHVIVSTTPLIPTLRAAIVRDQRGVPIWASASVYLRYERRRALRSEGRSPIFKVTDPHSAAMPVLVDFIAKEFERLSKESAEKDTGA